MIDFPAFEIGFTPKLKYHTILIRLCKFWTVEGLPGAGKAAYTSEIAEGLGLKDMGTSCLWWEHRRLKEFKGQPGLHHTWDVLIKDHHHFLAMRDVYMQKFFENPKHMVHSCRLQVKFND